MKFSLGWLCDYLDSTIAFLKSNLESALIQAGIEVDEIIDSRPGFEVVRVDEVTKHPNSDHLNICTVAGKQIVCGARNVRKGMYTVLANIDAIIPQTNTRLSQTTIRGVESFGMLCAASELGLFQEGDGIIEVEQNSLIDNILFPNGPIFDVSITPNRGDLLSVYGIAREMSVFGLGEMKELLTPDIVFMNSDQVVKIHSDSVLSMYTIKIEGLLHNITPNWMKSRLKEVGINSKSCVVDITNYIAHAFGQPLHAFDGDTIQQIQVREYSGEFIDLKGCIHQLDKLPCMISDNKCISVPGVIGGNYGKCQENSKNILLEAANYAQEYIFRAQKAVKNTDASKKFFYGVDPEMTKIALAQGASLIQELCGGSIQQATCALENNQTKIQVNFDDRYTKKLGIVDAPTYLSRLGFKSNNNQTYVVPSFRHDIHTPEGLFNEVLRLYGIDNVSPMPLSESASKYIPTDSSEYLRHILIAEGLYEAVGRDFMSKEMVNIFSPDILIENRMNSSQFAMRNSILSNLIEFYDSYLRYKWQAEGLFEIGQIFHGENVMPMVGIAIQLKTKDWLSSNINANYFNTKRLVERCAKYLYGRRIICHPCQHIILKDACEWRIDDKVIATFGIFQNKSRSFYMGELNLLGYARQKEYFSITDQEVLTKDISFHLPKEIFASQAVEKLRSVLPGIEVVPFDLYPSAELNQAHRSIAVRLVWSNLKNTLTQDQIRETLELAESTLVEFGCIIQG